MKHYTLTVLFAITASLASAGVPDRLIDALAVVESGNCPSAVGDGGNALGLLQIWSGVVADVNAFSGTHYTHSDALDPVKAREICRLYLDHYATARRLGHSPSLEECARIWNGGPNGHKKASTAKYWRKVEAALR